jgi:hypothetical protein
MGELYVATRTKNQGRGFAMWKKQLAVSVVSLVSMCGLSHHVWAQDKQPVKEQPKKEEAPKQQPAQKEEKKKDDKKKDDKKKDTVNPIKILKPEESLSRPGPARTGPINPAVTLPTGPIKAVPRDMVPVFASFFSLPYEVASTGGDYPGVAGAKIEYLGAPAVYMGKAVFAASSTQFEGYLKSESGNLTDLGPHGETLSAPSQYLGVMNSLAEAPSPSFAGPEPVFALKPTGNSGTAEWIYRGGTIIENGTSNWTCTTASAGYPSGNQDLVAYAVTSASCGAQHVKGLVVKVGNNARTWAVKVNNASTPYPGTMTGFHAIHDPIVRDRSVCFVGSTAVGPKVSPGVIVLDTSSNSSMRVVADTSTSVPGASSSTKFAEFHIRTGFDGKDVAFIGAQWNMSDQGVYRTSGGNLVRVANHDTDLPNTPNTPFGSFKGVAIYGRLTVFATPQGIFYADNANGNNIKKLVAIGETLDGKTVEDIGLGREGAWGNGPPETASSFDVGFWVKFTNGTEAVYMQTIGL